MLDQWDQGSSWPRFTCNSNLDLATGSCHSKIEGACKRSPDSWDSETFQLSPRSIRLISSHTCSETEHSHTATHIKRTKACLLRSHMHARRQAGRRTLRGDSRVESAGEAKTLWPFNSQDHWTGQDHTHWRASNHTQMRICPSGNWFPSKPSACTILTRFKDTFFVVRGMNPPVKADIHDSYLQVTKFSNVTYIKKAMMYIINKESEKQRFWLHPIVMRRQQRREFHGLI